MYYTDSVPKVKDYYKYFGNKKQIVKEERFYPNGQLMSVGEYDNNFKKTGTWKYFFDDGKKQRIVDYKNGVKNGKYVEYYRSGKKMFEGEYKNGLPQGKWIIYNQNGKKVSISKYINGKIVK
jgi:antitoxin component YwqK of YwqJK toxin-antitoxin module